MAKKTKSSLGVTFWAALLVFLVALYAANKINLPGLLGGSDSDGITQLFGGDYSVTAEDRGGAAEPSGETERPAPAAPLAEPVPKPPAADTPPPAVSRSVAAAPPATPAARQNKPAAENRAAPAATAAPAPQNTAGSGTPANPPAEKPAAAAVKTRDAVLYFIRLSDSGDVKLTKIPREIRTADAPLTDTLRALTAGPTDTEIKTGCTSLIPSGSRLLSVTVKDGVAFINFNEDFRFNSFGREGYDGQLKQLVYTATEFPTIQAVQILIDGNRLDYLGSEGIYIGRPIGRKELS
ncbi:MAG: GerMN domain-containing protein [Spirochaetales bacterium]|jgi:spore germination protein GerM|nr:GerMN domain-containing protein [Spirochaetales bacterium]